MATNPSDSIAKGVAYKDPQLQSIAFSSYTVATVPPASPAGQLIYVSNGAAGSPILAFSNGTNWLRCDTGAAIASS